MGAVWSTRFVWAHSEAGEYEYVVPPNCTAVVKYVVGWNGTQATATVAVMAKGRNVMTFQPPAGGTVQMASMHMVATEYEKLAIWISAGAMTVAMCGFLLENKPGASPNTFEYVPDVVYKDVGNPASAF